MRVEIDLRKGARENADVYYALSKKAKKKLGGLARGAEEIRRKLGIEADKVSVRKKPLKRRERKWYEKFHWFFTSEGFLVIAGRDAKSNENIVKRLMEKDDVYFHADIHGAPHTVLKTDGKKPGPASMQEAAVFAAVFSKAWAQQLASVDVYSARPEQVSKSAPSGESIGTGAFMVYGGREWFRKTPLAFAVGFKKTADSAEFFSGPVSAVKPAADFHVNLSFGDMPKGAAAKRIAGIFRGKLGKGSEISLDEIVALLPNGGIGISAV